MSSKDNRPIMRRRGASKEKPADVEAFISGSEPEATPGLIIEPRKAAEAETVTFNLRLPAPLHGDLKRLSEATGRSMHEICLQILEPIVRENLKLYE